MTWPFENDTTIITRKLAKKSFCANKIRNIIAIIAIALTTILFTSLFTLGSGMKENTQHANMILSGGDGHARIIGMNESEYNKISKHPLIQEMAYCRKLADSVENRELSKQNTLFEYYDDMGLKYLFVEPTTGQKPVKENEVMMDTATMELLGIPREIGTAVSLELKIHGQKIVRDFVLSGWWESYPGVSYGTIVASKAYVQAHKEELKNTGKKNATDTGSITGIIKFDNTDNIEENLQTVIKESGYSDDFSAENYINAGVNPFYSSSEASSNGGTIITLICVLMMFLVSGYLIIYNIFQISILRDLHFYGMLKTIGATGKQINSIVRRQAWKLSVVGIPIGLCCGFIIGKLLLPFLMVNSGFSSSAAAASPNPVIFLASALFALITVGISTRKPVKMAAKVSPVEAIRYTDSDAVMRKRKKKRSHSGNPQKRMAWANLGRNKKRTILVLLSLSVSIILTNTVFTFSHSVDPEKAIGNMIDSDFRIGQSSLLDYYEVKEESSLSESYIQSVQAQDGFEIGGAQYGCKAKYKSETTKQTVNQEENGSFATHLYGLDEFPYSKLQLVDGELDGEKLNSGSYILEGAYVDTRGVMDEESMNHAVGDKVKLEYNGKVQEFTVLGHVVANEANTYDWVGSCFFLASDRYKKFTGDAYAMSYKFNVADGKEAAVDRFLKEYTNTVEPEMDYESKETIMAGVKDIQNTVVMVGGTLAFIIGLIGVLNFANTVLTSIFTRRKELAILQGVGMTGKQVTKMLCLEGCNYTVVSAILSVPFCLLIALLFVRPICEQIWFLNFKMTVWPLFFILFALFLMGVLIPYFTCGIMKKQSVVDRLRCGE